MTATTAPPQKSVVERAIAQVGEIATLPEVTVKIIEIVENPRSTARDLHEVIKKDPALSAKVLKVVNSAFYGLPGQIASVDRAVVLLGLAAVKNIAIATSVARMFKGGSIAPGFNAKDLWKHSAGVAVTAKLIGKAVGEGAAQEEFFLAGLIHDLGILIERQVFPGELAEVVKRSAAGTGDFLTLENELIGANHQAFGEALATKWKFPRHLRAIVGFHHTPERISSELRRSVEVIHLADIICCAERFGFYLTAAHQTISDELLAELRLTHENIQTIREQLTQELPEVEDILAN
ncbi:MAG TPA: HDOD domain-containing protein [Phycisphaerae bacterium]|jgi:HD-like signal output (HDOD) protein